MKTYNYFISYFAIANDNNDIIRGNTVLKLKKKISEVDDVRILEDFIKENDKEITNRVDKIMILNIVLLN